MSNRLKSVSLTVAVGAALLTGCAARTASVSPVYFQSGSTALTSETDHAAIAAAAKHLEADPFAYLLLAGYADSTGDATANDLLSLQRADTIRAAVIASGDIDPDRVKVVALGEEYGTDGMQAARRVEFIFHDGDRQDVVTVGSILAAIGITDFVTADAD